MNDIDNELKKLRRNDPPAALDARVERSLRGTPRFFLRPVPAWACLFAAFAGVTVGVVASRIGARENTAVIPGAIFVAAANAEAASFPFVNRSFAQP